jgi:hypothetical protein
MTETPAGRVFSSVYSRELGHKGMNDILPQRLICHNFIVCGRYRLSRRKQILEKQFSAVSEEYDWTPRYNIAPTQPVPIIRQNPKESIREISLVRWGLIPSWTLLANSRLLGERFEPPTPLVPNQIQASIVACRIQLFPTD